jgi:uncharacterized membrane protein
VGRECAYAASAIVAVKGLILHYVKRDQLKELYLAYMHHRVQRSSRVVSSPWILAVAFVVLLVRWYGVNYLPSAANSVHTYAR